MKTMKNTLAAGGAALLLTAFAATFAAAQPPPPPPPAPPAPPGPARVQQENRAEVARARRLARLEATARVRGMQAERALLRGLQLTEEQRTRLRQLGEQRQAAMRDVNGRLREARQAIRQAQMAQTLDEAAIRRHAGVLAEAEAEQAIARARARGEMMGVLTAEQQAIVKERMQRLQERQQRMQQRLEEIRKRAQERAQQRRAPRV